ncbi:DNA binding domain-containing protein, excisionase family [Thermomonospora echinospora]|uniref:DNA binding domain-containing protein, excisionase family n=1 Tax=Thermomonospora echinospora TaxID=1992 RepID=A0A1H6E3M7_9ACTN|nr:helix-turn-helix domain-containing protein [Thermomonospora echinospora]SEG92177.1 DNA binding domain-containing protein, excisionase family [Thermomonospora echinospora]
MTDAPGDFLTVDETAALLKISRWKLYDLLRNGELASFHLGRRRLIPRTAIDDLVNRLMGEAA